MPLSCRALLTANSRFRDSQSGSFGFTVFDGNKREGFIKIIGKEALVMGIWIPE